MSLTGSAVTNRAFASLRSLAQGSAPVEHCELCSAALVSTHPHLVDPVKRRLVCVCAACAMLFSGQASAKFKLVPRRVCYLGDFQMNDAQWDSLMIPIGMAFFFQSSPDGKVVAFYPSPAGPTESLLSLEAWKDITDQNAALRSMEPDVEALLVNRVRRTGHNGGTADPEYYLVPIDECYRLVGLIRRDWRGFSGGAEVWRKIEGFFADLRLRSGCPGGVRRA
jgi:Family of unknown function (DUF5947)